MADILTPDKRSQNMSAIKSRDTKPEIYFRKLLFAEGLRYRKNSPSIIGHPDIYLAKYHTAIFVNGCFWHRHAGCKYAYTPKSRVDFWQKKFEQNIQRDAAVRESLATQGIKCLTIWECTIKRMKHDPDFETLILHRAIDFILSDSILFLEL
ncbi:very short patch repair endonuclease [Allofournierella massiliensis]|uniref:Very short patch repair endonuclease n=1 Tax=Allofournierella massiliensis TaxID=1650663 RepID=A0A4R1R7S7_9FIRM|nr:very short patch repair endonuclease [Fournierella massiliensis]TCL61674.1 T/G mismatch-specific endonuclease [Fournierella massiliensis]